MEYKETHFNNYNPKNARFLDAMRYLIQIKYIKNQKEFAELIGISENALSSIKKGRNVSDKTILKMLDAFPNLFNREYFFGNDVPMHTRAVVYNVPQDEQKQASEPISIYKPEHNPDQIPKWADTFIDLLTEQVKQNEALNRDLRAAISEVNELKNELSILINKLSKK